MKYFIHDPGDDESPESRRIHIIKALAQHAVMRSIVVKDNIFVALLFATSPDEAFILRWEDVEYLQNEGLITRHVIQ